MADYGPQQGRSNRSPPNFGQASSHERDAAFSSIFGAAPPPGRSQTMTSQSSPSPTNTRTQTMSSMSSQPAGSASRGGAVRPQQQQQQSSYFSGGYPQTNGTGHAQTSPPMQQQPQPQYLPQPLNPDRRPYGPQRVETRSATSPAQFNPNLPQRVPVPTPALNSNAYRTQSLASSTRPAYAPANSYGVSSANNFRQQPYVNRLAHTTAQGRVVPERHDERSMSMASYARDQDHLQTMSGRIIPNKRRESSIHELEARPSIESSASTQTYHSYSSQQPLTAGSKTRTPSVDTQSTRTMSMASTIAPSITPTDRTYSMTQGAGLPSRSSNSTSQPNTVTRSRNKGPLVYPAMLSLVGETFKQRMVGSEKEKDGLIYRNAFTGVEAVDLICYILQTLDRNAALLLGRALDKQSLFRDVTYEQGHRLRDSEREIYEFTSAGQDTEIQGFFTLMSDCYSPTCTPNNLCYTVSCPRRIEQQQRLNMKPTQVLKREESRASLHEERTDEQKLWINTVSKEVADSVDDREKKRQEVISELCYTERDFCKDLEYLRDFWIRPLRSPSIPEQWSKATKISASTPIPERYREHFVRTVFANCLEIYAVNKMFAEALTKRQQQNPVVYNVADLFLEFVPRFTPFIRYGANQIFGKNEFENEKKTNQAFARFADEVERLKESRKLELNGYLTKPTTRLARYPLLLENILKYTSEGSPDHVDIPKAIAGIKGLLSRVNVESGKAENRFNLVVLERTLTWRPNEYVPLQLTDPSRQLLFKGSMRKSPTDTTGEITAYLFDHALLFVRAKMINKREELKVYKRPIPLGLLVMSSPDDFNPKLSLAKRPSSSLIPGSRSAPSISSQRAEPNRAGGYPITFRHLGRDGFEQMLYCTSQIQRQKWYEAVEAQQAILRERANIFTKTILNEGFFSSMGMRINCCVPIDGGRKLVVGTDIGVYVTERKPKDASVKPRRVLEVKNVTQIDVLEQHSILLVLYDKTLYSYAIEALDPEESPMAPSKRGRKISHCAFFKIGVFEGEHLVCCVKSATTLSSQSDIKIYKPETMPNNKKKTGLARMLAGTHEVLKPSKEFYIPGEVHSIHFLRSTLCVGCANGFNLVTMATLQTQPLLDQADTSLDFVARKENLKPIHVERINKEFLLCFSDFSFFINRHGWRAFNDWKITWEGTPQSFAIFQPYILAFEPSFIEMRHLDTGTLVYILTAKNIRMLHSSTREILYAYEDELGEDVIASLDFWTRDGAANGPTTSRSERSP